MSLGLAAAGPSAYWYLTRGTGAVALLLITATVVIGVLSVRRVSGARWPRFLVDRLHRDLSLLVLALLVIHIVTSVLDGFAPIGLLDAVVPLHSAYRPVWLGLGAVAFDLLLAVTATSLVRRRLGYRSWRLVHWLAYVSWPVAVLHTLGTGSDAASVWLLALTAACLVAVCLAAAVRVVADRPGGAALAPVWTGLCALTPIGVIAFAAAGPLSPHWAARAGTPIALLRRAHPALYGSRPPVRAGSAAATVPLPATFTAHLSGTVAQTPAAGGSLLDLVLRCTGAISGELRVRMAGAPMPGGGLSLIGSQVQLTAVGLSTAMQGTVSALQGEQFIARVSGDGSRVSLHARLSIDQSSNTVTGTLTGTRV